jgi:hypothetical protein
MRHGSSVRRVRLWLIVEISNAVIADGRKLRGVTALLNYIRCPDVILLKRLVRLFCSIYDFGWYQELSDRVQPLSNKLYSYSRYQINYTLNMPLLKTSVENILACRPIDEVGYKMIEQASRLISRYYRSTIGLQYLKSKSVVAR